MFCKFRGNSKYLHLEMANEVFISRIKLKNFESKKYLQEASLNFLINYFPNQVHSNRMKGFDEI